MFLTAGVAYAASDWLTVTGSIQMGSTGLLTKVTDTKNHNDCYAYKDGYQIALSCVKQ